MTLGLTSANSPNGLAVASHHKAFANEREERCGSIRCRPQRFWFELLLRSAPDVVFTTTMRLPLASLYWLGLLSKSLGFVPGTGSSRTPAKSRIATPEQTSRVALRSSSFYRESQMNDVYASELNSDEFRMDQGRTRRVAPPPKNPFAPRPFPSSDYGSYFPDAEYPNDPRMNMNARQSPPFFNNNWSGWGQEQMMGPRGPPSYDRMEDPQPWLQEGMYSRSNYPSRQASSYSSYGMKAPTQPRGGRGYTQSPQPWRRPDNNMRRNGFEPLQAHPQRMSQPPPPPPYMEPYMESSQYMQGPPSDFYDSRPMDRSFFDGMAQRGFEGMAQRGYEGMAQQGFRPQRRPPQPRGYGSPSWFSDNTWDTNGRFQPRRPNHPPPYYPSPDGPRWDPRSQPGGQWAEMFGSSPVDDWLQTGPGMAQDWDPYGNNYDDDFNFSPRGATTSRPKKRRTEYTRPMGPSFDKDSDDSDHQEVVVDVLPRTPPDAVFSYTVPQGASPNRADTVDRREEDIGPKGYRRRTESPKRVSTPPPPPPAPSPPRSTTTTTFSTGRKTSRKQKLDPVGPSFEDSPVSREVVMGPKSTSRKTSSPPQPSEIPQKSSTSASTSSSPFIGFPAGSAQTTEAAKVSVPYTPPAAESQTSPQFSYGPPSTANGQSVESPTKVDQFGHGAVAAAPRGDDKAPASDVAVAKDSNQRVFIVGGIPSTSSSPPATSAVSAATEEALRVDAWDPSASMAFEDHEEDQTTLGASAYQHAAPEVSTYVPEPTTPETFTYQSVTPEVSTTEQVTPVSPAYSQASPEVSKYEQTSPETQQATPQLSTYEQQLNAFYSSGPPTVPDLTPAPPVSEADNNAVEVSDAAEETSSSQQMQSFYSGGPARR